MNQKTPNPSPVSRYFSTLQRWLRRHLTKEILDVPPSDLFVLLLGESGVGISRDEYIGQVAKDIENKMPKIFDLDHIRKALGIDISPTTVVLLQELERFNKLIVRMTRSLAELQRVSREPSCPPLPLPLNPPPLFYLFFPTLSGKWSNHPVCLLPRPWLGRLA